jgi:hypothetical protein
MIEKLNTQVDLNFSPFFQEKLRVYRCDFNSDNYVKNTKVLEFKKEQ